MNYIRKRLEGLDAADVDPDEPPTTPRKEKQRCSRVGAEHAALLEERRMRDESRKRTRAQVARQLAAEYDVGIRVNPELAKVERQGASSHDGVDESGTDSE